MDGGDRWPRQLHAIAGTRTNAEHIGAVLGGASAESDDGVATRLKAIYDEKVSSLRYMFLCNSSVQVLPIQRLYQYDKTRSTILHGQCSARTHESVVRTTDTPLSNKPVLLLTGPSRTGKTTAIEHLLAAADSRYKYGMVTILVP